MIGSYCRGMISEDTSLTPAGRERALRAISESASGGSRIDSGAFSAQPTVAPGFGYGFKSGLANPARLFVEVFPATGWKMRARLLSGETNGPEAMPSLETATAASVMLIQSLAALSPDDGLASRLVSVRRRDSEQWWAWSHWRLDYAARVALYWPVPYWSSFREFDLFLGLWSAAIEAAKTFKEPKPVRAGAVADRLDFLIYSWLNCAALVMEGKQESALTTTGAGAVRWYPLVQRLGKLLERVSASSAEDATVSWFRNITVLLMPEMIGNRPQIRKQFARSTTFKEFWDREATEITRVRLDTLSVLVAHELREFALEAGSVQMPEAAKIQLKKGAIELTPPSNMVGAAAQPPRPVGNG